MTAIGSNPQRPSTTEDTAATPGWVEQSVEEAFATLPQQPAILGLRNAYLECLAGARGPGDIDEAHDRCRRSLIGALRDEQQLAEPVLRRLEQRLEAIESDISNET